MKRQIRPLLFLPFALIAMLLLTTTGALAASPSTTTSKPHFYLRQDVKGTQKAIRAGGNLRYSTGPVQGGTANTYAIFWQPTNNVSPTYHSLIERYFQDVGSSGLYKNNTQYPDSTGAAPSGSNFAGSWTDHSAYPGSVLLDSDIQAEVARAQQANGWSSDVHNTFFVYTEKGEDICFDSSQTDCASNNFCGYHGLLSDNTVYAVLPYRSGSECGNGGSPNGDVAADIIIGTTSHEQMEAATDPLIHAWRDSIGQEIGDKCNNIEGNVTWNGHAYSVQKEWDNRVSNCVLTGP